MARYCNHDHRVGFLMKYLLLTKNMKSYYNLTNYVWRWKKPTRRHKELTNNYSNQSEDTLWSIWHACASTNQNYFCINGHEFQSKILHSNYMYLDNFNMIGMVTNITSVQYQSARGTPRLLESKVKIPRENSQQSTPCTHQFYAKSRAGQTKLKELTN